METYDVIKKLEKELQVISDDMEERTKKVLDKLGKAVGLEFEITSEPIQIGTKEPEEKKSRSERFNTNYREKRASVETFCSDQNLSG